MISKSPKRRVDVDDIPEQFWDWINDIVHGHKFGRLEITFVEGSVESVRLDDTYKPRLGIDSRGRDTIEWN